MIFQFPNHENASRKFCLLFGQNLTSSLSPKLHNSWFKKHHLNYIYEKYILHDSHEFIELLETLENKQNFLGGNVTMPFKQTLVERFGHAFIMSQSVKNTSSANTLFRDQNGKLSLENTDVAGIKKTLAFFRTGAYGDILSRLENVLILGAGGAAASCVYTVFAQGVAEKIVCLTRDPQKNVQGFSNSSFLQSHLVDKSLLIKSLDHVEDLLKKIFPACLPLLIINTLPLGSTAMYPESNYVCMRILQNRKPENTVYFDLLYENTDAFLFAQGKRIPSQNGMLMLETQAAESFKLWTGITVH